MFMCIDLYIYSTLCTHWLKRQCYSNRIADAYADAKIVQLHHNSFTFLLAQYAHVHGHVSPMDVVWLHKAQDIAGWVAL